nr:unnamed protein product [Callosobruchus chinensis]
MSFLTDKRQVDYILHSYSLLSSPVYRLCLADYCWWCFVKFVDQQYFSDNYATISGELCYKNKKKTRKYAAEHRTSLTATGGGPGTPWMGDPVLDLTLELMNKKTVHGLHNPNLMMMMQ